MIDLYGVLQEQETINGELGLGVDYYKGETGAQGIPGKDGKDGKTPIKGVEMKLRKRFKQAQRVKMARALIRLRLMKGLKVLKQIGQPV